MSKASGKGGTMDSGELFARAGHLAARFARLTGERVTSRAPAATAWEARWEPRLAARRAAAHALPRLTVSLQQLLEEAPHPALLERSQSLNAASRRPLDRRPAALSGGLPPRSPRALSQPAALPFRRSAPPETGFLPPRHGQGRPSAPSLRLKEMPGAAHLATHAEPRTNGESQTRDLPWQDLPAARLRETLVRQGGLGEGVTARLREKLRPHLAFDPALARLHRSVAAAAAGRALRAEAFTIGPDVFFGEGRYAPETPAGLGLLAHELTHVGQQAASVAEKMRFFTPHGGDAMEREAQQTAARVLASDDREQENRTGGALHQASGPPRQALAFALPSARTGGGFGVIPTQMATPEIGEPASKVGPAQADARAVTDRVYALMKQEIALGRERGS